VTILLGRQSIDACPLFDQNNDGQVTVEEIIFAVNLALSGCPEV
jgi:hypothetical protein